MKEPTFDSAPEFQHFREVMRGMLKVTKTRLDELVREAKTESSRKGNPHAPGRKAVKRKTRKGRT
jgi:hypothetical protein